MFYVFVNVNVFFMEMKTTPVPSISWFYCYFLLKTPKSEEKKTEILKSFTTGVTLTKQMKLTCMVQGKTSTVDCAFCHIYMKFLLPNTNFRLKFKHYEHSKII